MKNHLKHILAALLAAIMILGTLTACGANEPCRSCGATPTKGYKNDYTHETEYYCGDCASDCAFCSNKATKHYTSGAGLIVFVCDDCYEYIKEINS